MRVRIRYTTVFLSCIFCIIPIVCIMMFYHVNLVHALTGMNSGIFGLNHANIDIGSVNTSTLMEIIDASQARTAVYFDRSDGIRFIHFNQTYVPLPMKSGRFFKHSDFSASADIAVVGQALESQIHSDASGNPSITVGDKEYRVIGVLGYEKPTLMDNLIFLSLSAIDRIDGDSTILIDDLSTLPSQDAYLEFSRGLEKRGINITDGSFGLDSSADDVNFGKAFASRFFIYTLLCCFICLLLFSMQWLNSQKSEIAIRRLVGASPMRIALLIAWQYLAIAALSFAVGLAYCLIKHPDYIEALIKAYAVFSAFIVIFLLWAIGYLVRLKIPEALK